LNIIHKINLNEENICETFYCNGQEITEVQFMGVLEDLKSDDVYEYEDNENFENGTEEPCENCSCADCETIEECDCIDCTLDRYTKQIQEINGGCPFCIKRVLQDLMCCVVAHIVVEE
jgi:hypothetical protein